MITDTFKDLVVKLLVVTLKSSVLECSSARELVNSYDWLLRRQGHLVGATQGKKLVSMEHGHGHQTIVGGAPANG